MRRSSVIRERQIKTTVRYHLPQRGWPWSTETEYNKYWPGPGEMGTFIHCWLECKMVQPFGKIVWWFIKELNIELTYNPEIPQLGIYP